MTSENGADASPKAAALAAMSELSEAVLAVTQHLDTSTVLRTILRTARAPSRASWWRA